MSSCEACRLATKDPKHNHALAENGCFGCQARAIASLALHSESARTRRMTPDYRRVLQALFGNDWELGHAEVKRWAALMKGNK